jgi:membrane protein implicated in regulation of membrane protease activity
MSTVDAVSEVPAPEPEHLATPARARPARARRIRAASWLAPTSPALVYAGVLTIVAGFAVLAFAWSRVAGEAIVALQLPYVASGAFAGLGLVIVGVLLMYLAVKRRDAWQRDRRLDALAAALEGRRPADEETTEIGPASD